MRKQITLENINRKEVLRYLGYKGIEIGRASCRERV